VIEIIGAPFDLCGMRIGSRLGPDAIRLAGICESLRSIGLEVSDSGDVPTQLTLPPGAGLKHFDALLDCIGQLKAAVNDSIARHRVPVVLGGEHTLAVGGISAFLSASPQRLGVLWIDAHADINTPSSSSTGNIHGMPLAALWGLPSGCAGVIDYEWQALLDLLGPVRLDPENTAWFGLRDVDPTERPLVREKSVTMHDVDRYGMDRSVQKIGEWLDSRQIERLWVSFDVDALDPILAPGTGTAVRGGLTYREGHLLAELIHELMHSKQIKLAGVDLVETNPLIDQFNETASMAVEWIASLLGKSILGGPVATSD
jgi:arginase